VPAACVRGRCAGISPQPRHVGGQVQNGSALFVVERLLGVSALVLVRRLCLSQLT
jgi:hypothetical protein